MRRSAPLPDDICMCIPSLGRVCVWCERRAANPPETVEESDGLTEEGPLAGLGYRGADQDGYDGEEWVSPEEHNAGNLVEAIRVLFEAEEI